MVGKFIERLESVPINIKGWGTAFLGILFVRFLLENISSVSLNGFLVSDASTIVHYYLFYLGALISTIIVIGFFLPKGANVHKVMLFGLILSWLAPIFDLVISRGQKSFMAYIFTGAGGLMRNLAMFFGPYSPLGGITWGMRTELIIIILGIGFYVFLKTQSVWRSILVAILSYLVMFVWVSAPSVFKLVYNTLFNQAGFSEPVFQFFARSIGASVITMNFLHPAVGLSYLPALETFFNVAMSEIYYLLISVLLVIFFYFRCPNKLIAVFKNLRPFRVIHYWVMLIGGFLFAQRVANFRPSFNWVDVFSILTLFLSFYCAWMFAVGVNDVADEEIDKISNSKRPLIEHSLSSGDFQSINFFFLIWSLVGAFLAGHYTLYLLIVFTAAYYIYSAEPLRLKRVPILSTFLIAVASLSAIMAGFYFLNPDKGMKSFPLQLFLVVILFFTLLINMKDLKDIEGDKKTGIKTLPVIFGEKRGKQVVGFLAVLAYLIVPIILKSAPLIIPSLIAALFTYIFVNFKNYKEWRVFTLYFLYLMVSAPIFFGWLNI